MRRLKVDKLSDMDSVNRQSVNWGKLVYGSLTMDLGSIGSAVYIYAVCRMT